jgi:rRNA-processing protein FCF1
MPEEKNSNNEKNPRTRKNENERDIFVAESIYPELEPIFTAKFRTVDEVKEDCLVVLDTNALLVPYLIGKDSIEQIRGTYEKLVSEKRLLIPSQVVREFAKNRANKLTELYQQFNRKMSNINQLQKGRYPLLESIDSYEKTLNLEARIDKLMIDYKKTVKEVLAHIKNWTWDDPVSLLYADLFKGDVLQDLTYDKEKVQVELIHRQIHGIPPGYKDGGKEDNGIGDFLIWLTILEAGKTREKSLLFVSGEEKPDWFHKSEGQALYPRYELMDEYRRNSKGQSFHIVSFARLLNIFGASKSLVEEVQKEERKLNLEFSILGEFVRKWVEFERAVLRKCNDVSSKEVSQRFLSIGKMLNILITHEVISKHFSKYRTKI